MKKFLSAIAGLSILAAGILAATPAQAWHYFGEDPNDDLEDLLLFDWGTFTEYQYGEVELTEEQEELSDSIAEQLGIDRFTLLLEPERLNALGNLDDPNNPGPLTFSKNGCSVDVGCALPKIGLAITLKCVAKVGMDGTDPQIWANCIYDQDSEKYDAALACTWSNQRNPDGTEKSCDFIATSGQKVFACNKSPNAVVAGKVFLNLPPTLSQGKNDFMEIGLLSQG